MLRVTEIAFGIEKAWNHNHRDAHLVPWYICLFAIIMGIVCGDLSGFRFNAIVPHIFFLAIATLSITAICLIRKTASAHASRRQTVLWITAWFVLWFSFGFWHALPVPKHLPPEQARCTFIARVESVPPLATSIDIHVNQWICDDTSADGSFRARMKNPILDLGKDDIVQISGQFVRFERRDVPGTFDAIQWAHTKQISGRIIPELKSVPVVVKRAESFSAHIERARRHAFESLAQSSPHGLMPALILGSSKAISTDTRETFGHLGIAHVLAVSGLHFGIIAILVNALFNRFFGRIPWIMRRFGKKRAAALASIPTLALYLHFVGAPISAQRALLMIACCTCARMFAYKNDRTRALAMAGLLILTFNPYTLFEVSFQLSFSAVLGILWGMDFYERILRQRILDKGYSTRITKALCTLVSMIVMTISTSLTTAPFVIYHFQQLPIFGIVTNLVVIPYVSFILMPVAMFTSVCVIAQIPGYHLVTSLEAWTEEILIRFAHFCDETIPLSYLDMTPHPIVFAITIFTAIALLYRVKITRFRVVTAIGATMLMASCIVYVHCDGRVFTRSDDLRITFVAMGQADATLIEFPDGHTMLIDAGAELGKLENATQTKLLPYLRSIGIRRIDTLILTHSDYDHAAGLPVLFASLEIGEIWHNGLEAPMPLPEGVPLIDIGKHPPERDYHDTQIEILWPQADSKSYLQLVQNDNPNESSIVMRLDYGQFSSLFAGDAGIPVEEKLIERTIRPVTVLKAGHHGSKSASSQAFIDRLHPQMAVFSTGQNNRYRLPHLDVASRLHRANARLFNTAEHGTIRMTTNGSKLRVETAR